MTDSAGESLARLQGLQRDLSNLSSTTLQNIDRLWAELQDQLDAFKELLDKKGRNDQSRKTLNDAKESIKLNDDEYQISHAFKEHTVELSDALDLDELQAAKLLVDAQDEAVGLDRGPVATGILLFHQRRQFLLECLRLALEKAYTSDVNFPEELQGQFQGLVQGILQSGEGQVSNGSAYWRKCMVAMETLEKTNQLVSERIQSVAVTNQQQTQEFEEIMSFQSSSMLKQHESLGAILYWLTRGNWTTPDDLRFFITRAKAIDRYDASLVHYLPGLLRLVSTYASSEGHCSRQEADSLSSLICSKKDSDAWAIRTFQAGVTAVWLAEYSARFGGGAVNVTDTDSESRSSRFADALKDGAFHFLLSVGNDVKDHDWYDPARKGMTTFLVQDAPALQAEPFRVDPLTANLIFEQLQDFVSSYIINMPDSLRQLKYDQDEQRRQVQNIGQSRPSELDLNLERFLLIIAFAYEGSESAAEEFWDNSDGNLYGFLLFASQRQSTPHAAVFCEMLSTISKGNTCANYAHRFLLGEATTPPTKLRRNYPLSWNLILGELELFAAAFKNRPAGPAGSTPGRNNYGDQIEEPESELMLECYLRLISHLASESSDARAWLLTTTAFRLVDHLIMFCGSGISSRTRACAFNTMAGLLSGKDEQIHKDFWTAIDTWIFGQSQNSIALQGRVPQTLTPQAMEKIFFQHISGGFEEPSSVVSLFIALISPVAGDAELNNTLPFPEDLGAKYRMAGIDSYVDFVMNEVFARKSVELQDPIQLRIIRLNCLTFASSCLSSFNENLILFASQTSLSVDSAMGASSLATYARIHPFARVMEWFFNDSVVDALFSAAMQDIDDVNAASEDSPLVLSLLKSLEVLDMILSMQSTYFDLIRPIIKTQSATRRPLVANSALASFEDAVTNHIDIVRMLGIYSGSGQISLAAASLRLLQRLSRSRKLATPVAGGSNRRSEKSRLITALEKEGEAENISRSLAAIMQFDTREVEGGPESSGIIIKSDIISFLSGSLETMSDRPSAAHLLLGYSCDSHSLYAIDDTLFGNGTSLFHALAAFIIAMPDGPTNFFVTWLLKIKNEALLVLQRLWRSRLSSLLTLQELRRTDFLLNLAVQQEVIRPDSLWDGIPLQDPAFFVQDAASGLAALLSSRSVFLECAATELRFAKMNKLSTLQSRIQASLFGSTTLLDTQQFVNPAIFDYLDFLDIELGTDIPLPISTFFPDGIFDVCKEKMGEDEFIYNISSVEQILHLRQSSLPKQEQASAPTDQDQLQADAANIYQTVVAHNQRIHVQEAKMNALRSWVQLAMVMLDCCELTATQQVTFVLQLLQQTLPWLEKAYSDNLTTAGVLAKFGLSLLRHVDFKAFSSESTLSTDTANDRLYQLFRAAALGLQFPEAPGSLRETCAQICRCYMQNLCQYQKRLLKRALGSIKSIGDNLIETVCDDACTGDSQLRLSSMLLLESVVIAANQTQTSFVLEAFSRLNFIPVVARSLCDIPADISAGGSEHFGTVVSFYRMSLGLLLRVAQSRVGAGHVLNAGFFNAVRDSGIFAVDPDLGLDVDNPQAMTKYLELLLSFTHVVNAIVVSRGSECHQTMSQGRQFLHEYRSTIVSILKRNAGIGFSSKDNKGVLEELVDNFSILVHATAFLETEEDKLVAQDAPRLFS